MGRGPNGTEAVEDFKVTQERLEKEGTGVKVQIFASFPWEEKSVSSSLRLYPGSTHGYLLRNQTGPVKGRAELAGQ